MQARLRPDKVALVDLVSDRKWSYRQLDHFVATCVSVLTTRGTGQADRIACLSRNCAEMVVLHHACARLGAIFVPLNWRLSAAELEFLLDDCRPSLLYGDTQVEELGFEYESVASLSAECAQANPAKDSWVDPDLPSLILFTSGTTGRPKGALLSERNLTETAINFTLLGNVNTDSTFLCDAPMFHVIGLVTNVRPAFFAGGRLLVSDAFDPDRTLDRLMDSSLEITHYFCVPQMANILRQCKSFDASRLGHLTAIFTGGAPHPEPQIREWLNDGIPIVDGFGMSEAGTVFGMPIDPELIARKAGCVGIPTPRVQARVVDENGAERAAGVPGDLQLRGENLFQGYWGLEDEYQATVTKDGWFRTGDIATKDDGGYYRIVDRQKDMFISGGENVYPAEIEAIVCGNMAVAECAVVGVPDERWGEVGFLFVVGKPEIDLDLQSLLNSLDGRLARYKIPRHASAIEKLPRNAAGKLLKADLRDQAAKRLARGKQ